ncbi:MAG: hypothetical protein ACFCVK_04775 [Acidimicrobiales bacterium]
MVFNAASDGFSDVRLMRAMDRLSAGGRLAYTENQLYYAVTGRRVVKPGVVKRLRRAPHPPEHTVAVLSPGRFQASLGRWFDAGAEVRGRLLLRHEIAEDHNRQPREGTVLHPELTAHGFGRLVVVDHAPMAVMLVANNFHVDQRCAVISEDGYPETFRVELAEVLNRNPQLVVAAVHGATIPAMGLVRRLRSWFPNPSTRLIEVGLRPAQVIKANLPANRDNRRQPDLTVLDDPLLARLDEWEREWLAWGLSTRLDSLSPQGLMNAISRVFTAMARDDERALTERALAVTAVGGDDVAPTAPGLGALGHTVDPFGPDPYDPPLDGGDDGPHPGADADNIFWWDRSQPLAPGEGAVANNDDDDDEDGDEDDTTTAPRYDRQGSDNGATITTGGASHDVVH